MIVSVSIGLKVLRSITSESIPLSLSNSAASKANFNPIPKLTIVTSFPLLLIRAFPIGTVKLLSIGTSKLSPYRISFSKKITGLGSLIEDFNNPLASSD